GHRPPTRCRVRTAAAWHAACRTAQRSGNKNAWDPRGVPGVSRAPAPPIAAAPARLCAGAVLPGLAERARGATREQAYFCARLSFVLERSGALRGSPGGDTAPHLFRLRGACRRAGIT